MNVFEYNRIIIVGNNGSGKSFLSEKLSSITGLPLVHLDALFWLSNWKMPSKDVWKMKNIELISEEKWILDGNVNHGGTMEMRFVAADLIIFLDINRFICLASVLVRNGKKRSDTTQYRNEKFDNAFYNFCKGIWNYFKTRKLALLALHNKYPDKPFYVIGCRRKMKKLINQWSDEKANHIC